jgi:hypothetical protein
MSFDPDFYETPAPRPRRRRRRRNRRLDSFWNLLTFLLLIALVGAIGFFVLIYRSPASPLNPFPPPTVPAVLQLPTGTPEPVRMPATWTPTPEPVIPTETPAPTQTLPGMGPSATPEAEGSSQEKTFYSFAMQDNPEAINAALFSASRACKWMGVAGQVFDMQGRPATGIRVQLGGSLEGKTVDLTSLTGTAIQYGQAGYEFTLADKPIATEKQLWVRLLDQADIPLSEKVRFDTYEDCQKTLIVINFRKVQ